MKTFLTYAAPSSPDDLRYNAVCAVLMLLRKLNVTNDAMYEDLGRKMCPSSFFTRAAQRVEWCNACGNLYVLIGDIHVCQP